MSIARDTIANRPDVATLARELALALTSAQCPDQWSVRYEAVALEVWDRMEPLMRALKARHAEQPTGMEAYAAVIAMQTRGARAASVGVVDGEGR